MAAQAKQVPCPYCKAPAGEACFMYTNPLGVGVFGPQHVGMPHRERFAVIKNHHKEDKMSDTEHTIELVLRFKTNGYRDELDELMGYGPQIEGQVDRDLGASNPETRNPDAVFYATYVPEGSHWRCVDVDPAAADLPGGNRLEGERRASAIIDDPDAAWGQGANQRTEPITPAARAAVEGLLLDANPKDAAKIGASLAEQRNQYRDALADIWAILRPDATDQWSVGMLEDIAEIVKHTGVKHNDPPTYLAH